MEQHWALIALKYEHMDDSLADLIRIHFFHSLLTRGVFLSPTQSNFSTFSQIQEQTFFVGLN